jgi:hypothetical protein
MMTPLPSKSQNPNQRLVDVCPRCGDNRLHSLESDRIQPDMQCFRCDRCGYLWGVVDSGRGQIGLG